MASPNRTVEPSGEAESELTRVSAILNSPKFHNLLQKLANDNERRILVELVQDIEEIKSNHRAAIQSKRDAMGFSIYLDDPEGLCEKYPGLTSADLIKLACGILGADRYRHETFQVYSDAIEEAREAEDIKAIHEQEQEAMLKYAALYVSQLSGMREVYHRLQGLNPQELQEIDDAFDTMEREEGELSVYWSLKLVQYIFDKTDNAGVPFSLAEEALNLFLDPAM